MFVYFAYLISSSKQKNTCKTEKQMTSLLKMFIYFSATTPPISVFGQSKPVFDYGWNFCLSRVQISWNGIWNRKVYHKCTICQSFINYINDSTVFIYISSFLHSLGSNRFRRTRKIFVTFKCRAYPNLAVFTKCYLSVPATRVPCERLFLAVGLIKLINDNKRSSL